MGENSDDNDPFEEDIVFDQSGLLTSRSSYSRQQLTSGIIPTFMLFIRTVFLCVAFIGLGLCASVSQSPVIHLEVAVGVPTQNAFHSFTAHSIGMLIGGLIGSALFEIYNRQFLIFVSLMWMSVSVSVLPFTIPVSYWWTLVNLAALGAGLSFLFTGSNVLCLDLWGKQGGASLQSLHFSFAVGAFIAPILIHPFISDAYPQQFVSTQKEGNFSPLSPISSASSSLKLQKLKRSVDNFNLSEDISTLDYQKMGNLSIHSTSLENLTLPEEHFKENITEGIIFTSVSNITGTENIKSSTSSPLNETQPIKVPKPKPSFTNANLIPEHSKWKRPPQKDTLKNPEVPKVDSVSNTHSNSSNTMKFPLTTSSSSFNGNNSGLNSSNSNNITSEEKNETSSISEEVTQSNDTNTDSPYVYLPTPSNDTKIISNVSNGDLKIINSTLFPDYDLNSTVDINLTSNSSEAEKVVNISDVKVDNVSLEDSDKVNSSSILKEEYKGETNISSSPYSSQSHKNETYLGTISPAVTPEDIKYVIDFSNGYSSWDETKTESVYPDGFVEQDFSDYNFPLPKITSEKKSPFTEPELLDLKELPTSDEESSTISIAGSLLSNAVTQEQSSQSHQLKPGTFSNSSDNNIRFFETLVERFKNYGVTSIHFVYICVGIFLLLNAFVSVIIMCHNPREPRSKQEDLSGTTLNKVFFCVFSVFMFASEAVEGAIRHLLASSQTENGLPVSKGMDGATLFWGLVCVMRFLCILISGCLKVKPGKILVTSTFLTVVGTIFLCIGTFDKRDFLWGGIVVVALGLAPILPTSFLWMAEHMRVSHRLCATMIVISSFGNSLTHTTLTHVLANSHLYAYILIGISSGAMIFLSISFCLLYRAQNAKTLTVPIGYQLANQEEEETLELTRPTPKNFDNMNRRLSEMGEAGQALLID